MFMTSVAYGLKMVAQNVTEIIVPNSGHWIPEEQPVVLAKILNNFFSSDEILSSPNSL